MKVDRIIIDKLINLTNNNDSTIDSFRNINIALNAVNLDYNNKLLLYEKLSFLYFEEKNLCELRVIYEKTDKLLENKKITFNIKVLNIYFNFAKLLIERKLYSKAIQISKKYIQLFQESDLKGNNELIQKAYDIYIIASKANKEKTDNCEKIELKKILPFDDIFKGRMKISDNDSIFLINKKWLDNAELYLKNVKEEKEREYPGEIDNYMITKAKSSIKTGLNSDIFLKDNLQYDEDFTYISGFAFQQFNFLFQSTNPLQVFSPQKDFEKKTCSVKILLLNDNILNEKPNLLKFRHLNILQKTRIDELKLQINNYFEIENFKIKLLNDSIQFNDKYTIYQINTEVDDNEIKEVIFDLILAYSNKSKLMQINIHDKYIKKLDYKNEKAYIYNLLTKKKDETIKIIIERKELSMEAPFINILPSGKCSSTECMKDLNEDIIICPFCENFNYCSLKCLQRDSVHLDFHKLIYSYQTNQYNLQNLIRQTIQFYSSEIKKLGALPNLFKKEIKNVFYCLIYCHYLSVYLMSNSYQYDNLKVKEGNDFINNYKLLIEDLWKEQQTKKKRNASLILFQNQMNKEIKIGNSIEMLKEILEMFQKGLERNYPENDINNSIINDLFEINSEQHIYCQKCNKHVKTEVKGFIMEMDSFGKKREVIISFKFFKFKESQYTLLQFKVENGSTVKYLKDEYKDISFEVAKISKKGEIFEILNDNYIVYDELNNSDDFEIILYQMNTISINVYIQPIALSTEEISFASRIFSFGCCTNLKDIFTNDKIISYPRQISLNDFLITPMEKLKQIFNLDIKDEGKNSLFIKTNSHSKYEQFRDYLSMQSLTKKEYLQNNNLIYYGYVTSVITVFNSIPRFTNGRKEVQIYYNDVSEVNLSDCLEFYKNSYPQCKKCNKESVRANLITKLPIYLVMNIKKENDKYNLRYDSIISLNQYTKKEYSKLKLDYELFGVLGKEAKIKIEGKWYKFEKDIMVEDKSLELEESELVFYKKITKFHQN